MWMLEMQCGSIDCNVDPGVSGSLGFSVKPGNIVWIVLI